MANRLSRFKERLLEQRYFRVALFAKDAQTEFLRSQNQYSHHYTDKPNFADKRPDKLACENWNKASDEGT